MAHFVYLNVVLRHFLGAMFLNVISVVPEETKKKFTRHIYFFKKPSGQTLLRFLVQTKFIKSIFFSFYNKLIN